MKPFRYAETPPAPSIASHVLSCWAFDVRLPPGEPFVHHVWPDGCVSLSVVCRAGELLQSSVLGPGTRAQRVDVFGGITYRGARFWPDAGGATLGLDPSAIRERLVPIEQWLAGEALDDALAHARAVAAASDDDAAAARFAEWLAPRVAGVPLDTLVREAARRLIDADGELAIAALASDLGVGPRQLQRRFGRATGVSPKEYARVRRVRAAIVGILQGEDRWATLAHSLGFADQAHLVREMGEMTGLTPQRLEDRVARIEHGRVGS